MLGNIAAIFMVLALLKVLGWAFERPWVGWTVFAVFAAGAVFIFNSNLHIPQ